MVDARTGASTSYAELDRRSRQLAAALDAQGLTVGHCLAVVLPNSPRYLEVAWAAQRAGLYYVPVNWHLTASEGAYMAADAGAEAVIGSPGLEDLARAVAAELVPPALCLAAGGEMEGFVDLDQAMASADPDASAEVEGYVMFYSSGTTGRPKGIRRPITGVPFGRPGMLDRLLGAAYGVDHDTIYLCPAPLYHAAPLGWSMAVERLGGTVVVMERFDPVECLATIERYRVTHVQMVPTMFVRLLKLDPAVRDRYDLSSLRCVVHAAAPCPVEVKRQVMKWWGPIVHEYYAGSEGNGFCAVGPEEWLAHPGTVGRPLYGELHILDDDGDELPPGAVGTVYFGGTAPFEYHNDPDKTRQAFDSRGWSTLGDMGSVDDEGYLYLSDRRTNLIITGGVNVYPREVEDVLTMHLEVADVAVVGEPDEEMGQRVVAVVEPMHPERAGAELGAELQALCRANLAGFKCPREVRFVDHLPRLPTGKLAKHRLRPPVDAPVAREC